MNEQKKEMNFPVGGTEPTFERDLSTGSSPALVGTLRLFSQTPPSFPGETFAARPI